MRKRMLQVLVVVGLVGALGVFGIVQAVRSHQEKQLAAEKVIEDQLAQERATAAWQELEEKYPQIHMGCASTIDDMLVMASQVKLDPPETKVEEVVDEPVELAMGALYSGQNRPLVAVDAGHLGYTSERYKNTGAQSVLGTIEHEWSLEVAWVLKDELVSRGYDVYMVRDTDDWKEFPYNNAERTEAVNALECDILVAIHWDSFDQSQVDGYHTIYKGNGKSPNYRLAKAVSDAYGKAINGGVSKFSEPVGRDDLWQLNVATMPAIILECGFSSNESDARYLEDPANHILMADGIADGIDAYFIGEFDREEAAREAEQAKQEVK